MPRRIILPGDTICSTACANSHAAAAINGIALHGGLIPYGGTFFVFSDYMRPAMRLAALMRIRAIHVLTHDSIGLGEDGPTHQPVEQLASCGRCRNVLCSGRRMRWRRRRPGNWRSATPPAPP